MHAMLNGMGATELAGTGEYAELREAYRSFIDEHVYAAEPALARAESTTARAKCTEWSSAAGS
jgi:hypothetical protein